jgi:hypothetical protein
VERERLNYLIAQVYYALIYSTTRLSETCEPEMTSSKEAVKNRIEILDVAESCRSVLTKKIFKMHWVTVILTSC